MAGFCKKGASRVRGGVLISNLDFSEVWGHGNAIEPGQYQVRNVWVGSVGSFEGQTSRVCGSLSQGPALFADF